MRGTLVTYLLLFCVGLTGCVTSSVSRLNNTERDPIPPSIVKVYLEEEDIEGEFEKMALIDLSGSSGWTDQEDLFEKAREEAAAIGANGVLFRNYEEAGTGEQIAAAFFGTPSDNDSEMIAIYVYREWEEKNDEAAADAPVQKDESETGSEETSEETDPANVDISKIEQ
ncbi:hypothetical protein CRI94_16270 [Longibacter salinarum]|uniref:Uncharacterized protein n=2 Tax=Longibacter salinarum TaxID=1850348 RepID=A0A2A8CU68_9BACT|nr:hypothetical protein CRI94_16270 [Longibacter salinarum]